MAGPSNLATAIGKGLVAGFAGTAAMTVSSTIEMKLRDREGSSAPADATMKVLGIEGFADDAAKARFSNLVHWGYGTGWGVVRGLLSLRGPPPAKATAAHFSAAWGNEAAMRAALRGPPP